MKKSILLLFFTLIHLVAIAQLGLGKGPISQHISTSEPSSIEASNTNQNLQQKAMPPGTVVIFASKKTGKKRVKYRSSGDPTGILLKRLLNRTDIEIIKVRSQKNHWLAVKFAISVLPIDDWIRDALSKKG